MCSDRQMWDLVEKERAGTLSETEKNQLKQMISDGHAQPVEELPDLAA
jgi:hypothetical protein